MSKFIRLVNHSLKDIFISNVEDFSNSSHQFEDCPPNPFTDCDFEAILGCLSEELTNCLVSFKALDHREHIVLQGYQGCACNLSSEVAALTFAKAKQTLALFEDYFQRPSPGIDLVGFKESKPQVSTKQSAPWATLASAYKEESDRSVCEDDICTHVPALEFSGIFLFAPLFKCLYDGRSIKILPLKMVFSPAVIANLNHSKIVALDMTSTDILDYLGTSKPAVGQHITEFDFMEDRTFYHFNGKMC